MATQRAASHMDSFHINDAPRRKSKAMCWLAAHRNEHSLDISNYSKRDSSSAVVKPQDAFLSLMKKTDLFIYTSAFKGNALLKH